MLVLAMNGMSPIGDAAYDLLDELRGKFESFRAAAYGGEDPEAIHQMRVNARRLRSCFRAFDPVLAQPVRELEPELQWIAVSLGEVRDIDVLAEKIPAARTILGELRTTRLAQLRADLDSARYANLAEALRCRIAVAVHDNLALATAPVAIVAPDIVALAYRAARRASRAIDENSEPAAIHTLRKRAKRLRYTADCFSSLYGKAGKRFIASLKDLQDLLGAYQDAIVAQAICAELLGRGADAALDAYSQDASNAASDLRLELPNQIVELDTRWTDLWQRMRDERRNLWRNK